jgi:hypothetical protein
MMASTARIRQRKLGQRSGLLEDFITDEGRCRRAAVMGHHGAPQLTQRLKVVGAHAGILAMKGW